MTSPKFAMFFDLHTMKYCPELGQHFDAEKFADQLEQTGVELVGFHAKCNQGFCYYATEKGVRHPGLAPDTDLFGEVVSACSQHNIGVSAYFNCGLSNEQGVQHPEWCRINRNGQILHPELAKTGWVSPYIRTMCVNSPYRNYLMQLITEVRDKYPVRGFLFDSFNPFPCVCPHCVAGMKKLGLDPSQDADVLKFAKFSVVKLAEDIAQLVQPHKNNLLVYFLGLPPRDNARLGSYLEGECLPTNPAWGYDLLPLTSRYFRTLTDRPIFNMTGRFNNWGDFGTLRPEPALEYDFFFGLANGMRPNIGDHLHPNGRLFPDVFKRIGKIYHKIKQYDFWFEDAKNLTDLAIVIPEWKSKTPSLTGMIRMLSELKYQFDVIDPDADWSRYSLVLLPDDLTLTGHLAEQVKRHLKRGGKIVATGNSGLNASGTAFEFEEAWGLHFVGSCPHSPAYFTLVPECHLPLPDLPLSTGIEGYEVQAFPETQVLGEIIAPYFNKHWDGVYSYFYTPPQRKTNLPFLTRHHQVSYCAFPLGVSYYRQAAPELRQVLDLMIKQQLPQPLLKTDQTLPRFARAFVTAKHSMRIIHLLNYIPELRGESLMLEDCFTLHNLKVQLRVGKVKVKKVYLAPQRTPVDFVRQGDYVTITLPELTGYAMVVVETTENSKVQDAI